MCGIVGAIAQRPVAAILLEGLRRLEYRGYDSAGLAVLGDSGRLERRRTLGKVARLAELIAADPVSGTLGIAHTRWATHGEPATHNAHPHLSGERCALVHNGIIENHNELRDQQRADGYVFTSETDTEVIVHAIHAELRRGLSLVESVRKVSQRLRGAYALGVIDAADPDHLVAARHGSPLVIGVGFGEHFIASDVFALLPVTNRFIFLEDGDLAELSRDQVRIWDRSGRLVERPLRLSTVSPELTERGPYRHYMQKEIFEQPRAIADTLEGRLMDDRVLPEIFGTQAAGLFAEARALTIVACGTSFHAALVARHWIEGIAGLPCQVEVASEYRYRRHIVPERALFLTLSQSGETADTLAALRRAKDLGYLATLAICNVPESSLVRESDLVFLTHAGPEIGVASTKAFTTQLVALLLLTIALGRFHQLDAATESRLVALLRSLPGRIDEVLRLDATIAALAERFIDKQHALFLGRGEHYPIAMEGALKLKEISYIHAEAYAAGELKHGPLALIDEQMPVVALVPNNILLAKLKSNLEEVRARGGQLIAFADFQVPLEETKGLTIVRLPETDDLIDPLIFSIPLQLLAYHVAVLKGTDVDQPRNLAKSVTVE
ncbi:glutamine--fructose-6-phosphate transaminase (isomerizing) [Thermochromatium tepidum]|jgi:glutamine--fructose-6-phosphate transaminase (EC 2.6.1.16)|uniref:Glutamine--fructose-6-phosphate aminotransferase [isomerizing] n=1 Tax=Thermochromatium tepidum ATCC 43061 TaxID=316276 RepID=A0A6I6E460_THETI|nr:glutamine--fructose-6-phosphate transaminase (isomerizing) [Thermochromatium tepidum]QGU33745.1 glutamine--fructose-6-phosphate transaminase (isomerizing) [Thermochromatium tepidum ATCC 43061]